MYTLLKTVGRRLDENGLVDEIDASQVSLMTLSQYYHDLFFVIKVDVYPKPKVLWYKDIPLEYQISHLTIIEYLQQLNNKTIELQDTIPEYTRGEVYSYDVGSYPFEYYGSQLGAHKEARLEEEDKEDLVLSLPGKDHTVLGQYSLIAINGLFHFFDYNKDGWYILEGNKTRNKQRDKTHINVLDFTQVGKVKMIPITDKMIKQPGNVSLKDNVYIDCEESFVGKTVGICIGGYLHLMDHTYKQISDHSLKIDFNNIRWESLYYKMKEILNLDKKFPITELSDDRVIGFELYHDKTIRNLFKLSQSFIVVIDNPYVKIIEEAIGHIGTPKRYESGIPPLYPIRLAEGRYPAYKAIKNLDAWVISIEDNIVPLQVRYQREDDDFHIRHNQPYAVNGEVYGTAHYVRFISDQLKSDNPIKPFIERDINDVYYRTTDKLYSFLSQE